MSKMQRRIGLIFLTVFAALGIVGMVLGSAAKFGTVNAAISTEKIDPDLLLALADGSSRRIIIDLANAAPLPQLDEDMANTPNTAVVERLQAVAATSQVDTVAVLADLAENRSVTNVRPLWIVNSIAATGNLTAVQTIASLPEVAQVRLDTIVQQISPTDVLTDTLLAVDAAVVTGPVASWGIDKINAPAVWHGLGIDGSGVTVAILDTGVDWEHPDLMENYRGNSGGVVDHTGHWFNAVIPTSTVPTDTFGHGTHVAGTAVGHNGLGAAPGAQWIAVNVADSFGLIWESDVHRGFEWLLAPNGEPALAPDVVNSSWGSHVANTLFVDDIAALHAAGIHVVFSAGNNGPFTETIGYPAGYPGVLSVGASDEQDRLAWFSSRGPSSLSDEIKPFLVAPGWEIWSALPGGLYGSNSGTSMSAPHVAGTIALLLSANPSLARPEVNQIMAETAVPISTTHPNNDSGWGRLDAYAAVASQTSTGRLTGLLLDNGTPLPNQVVSITTSSGAALPFITNANGRYEANLQAGSYTVSSQPFGYTQISFSGVSVTAGQTTMRNLMLSPLPGGQVEGVVRGVVGYDPLANAQIEVVNTPLTTETDSNGRFELSLPAGTYELVVRKTGYQQQRAEIWLGADTAVVQNFFLADAPAILLVDSGDWYFSSQAELYIEALNALNYSFDTWTVHHPLEDKPLLQDLTPYQTVIWSSPNDSPGFLGLNDVITDYLGLGGQLFISGQNVGAYDGVGLNTQVWWYRDLYATFFEKTAVTHTISGADNSLFSGLSFTLNGGSSSDNQTAPDVAGPRPNGFTQPAFMYDESRAAGLTAGYCTPFRLVYLGFGLEGVTEADDRAEILARSFSLFAQPREQYGSQFQPDTISELAIPAEQMVYRLNLFNRSEIFTDTFTLSISGAAWATNLVTQTVTLGPCQTGETILTLDVPPDLPEDMIEEFQVTAVSSNNPAAVSQLTVTHKTPGRILFVDDDRWYDQTAELTAALNSLNLPYDSWDTDHGATHRNGPPLSLLQQYDFVIWYTGYDWFQPITYDELQNLEAYLAQGGRLFLNSQDFLFYHHHTTLARTYFGVADYLETVEPEQLWGLPQTAVASEAIAPVPLDFTPYQNHGDGILPAPHSQPFLWHDRALPAATATASDTWRAIFWAFPFETITPTRQTEMMNQVLGWLSDLGDSSFVVDQRVGLVGEPRTYTITVRQMANGPGNQAVITNTLSPWLQIDLASISGGATYDPAARQLSWSGLVGPGSSHQITYQATPQGPLPPGQIIENEVQIYDEVRDLSFSQTATSWVNAPEITATITAVPNQPLAATTLTYTVSLANVGLADSTQISTAVSLPNTFYIVTDTLASSSGTPAVGDRRLYWTGDLAMAESVTLTLVLTREMTAVPQWTAAAALIDDQVTTPTFFADWIYLPVFEQFFPILLHTKR